MSIPKPIAYKILHDGLERQFPKKGFLYEICDYLWHETIFNDPSKNAIERGCVEVLKKVPPEKRLGFKGPSCGLPIGNLTSQLLSNAFLNELDQFVTKDLGYKYYGRYVDDFYFMVPEELYAQAKLDIARIEDFLRLKLCATLHPKKRCFTAAGQGVEFLGARIYKDCILPSDRYMANLQYNVAEWRDGLVPSENIDARLGIIKHLNGTKSARRVLNSVGYLDWGAQDTQKEQSTSTTQQRIGQSCR